MRPTLLLVAVLVGATGMVVWQALSSGTDRADALLPEDDDQIVAEVAPLAGALATTRSWVNAYSLDTTVDGSPVPIDSVITAFSPAGKLVGRTVVKVEGQYGVMALYMDDGSTPVANGGSEGDHLTFRIDNIPALVVGPDEPVLTTNRSLLQLDLVAVTTAD